MGLRDPAVSAGSPAGAGASPDKHDMLSREWELNPRPADYESAALPLSYLGGKSNVKLFLILLDLISVIYLAK